MGQFLHIRIAVVGTYRTQFTPKTVAVLNNFARHNISVITSALSDVVWKNVRPFKQFLLSWPSEIFIYSSDLLFFVVKFGLYVNESQVNPT